MKKGQPGIHIYINTYIGIDHRSDAVFPRLYNVNSWERDSVNRGFAEKGRRSERRLYLYSSSSVLSTLQICRGDDEVQQKWTVYNFEIHTQGCRRYSMNSGSDG